MDRKNLVINKVEVLVKDNLIEDALTELERCVSINYHDLKKDVILLKSRCSDIRHRRMRGVIDFKEEVTELNKIKSSIVELLDRIKFDVQKIEIPEEGAKEKLENSFLKTKYKHKIFDEWLGYFSEKLLPLLPIGMLIIGVYFLYGRAYVDLFVNPKVQTKFTLLINENKFKEANVLVDSVYSLNTNFREYWDAYRQEVFSRNLDFILLNQQLDSAKTLFYNYRFSYLFPDNPNYKERYNSEVQWFNSQINKAIIVFCKHQKHELISEIIHNLCRPTAMGDFDKISNEKGGYQKGFQVRDSFLQEMQSACTYKE